jgi:hypothetical protein
LLLIYHNGSHLDHLLALLSNSQFPLKQQQKERIR